MMRLARASGLDTTIGILLGTAFRYCIRKMYYRNTIISDFLQTQRRSLARALQPFSTSQISGALKRLVSLQLLWSNLRVIVMSRLNFNVNAYDQTSRRRSSNPRRLVSFRTPLYISWLYWFAVGTTMTMTFALVWYA